MMETLNRAATLAGYMTLPYSIAVGIGAAVASALDNPIPLIIGVAVGLLWAVVGAAAWAAGA